MAILHVPKAQIKFKNFEGRESRFTPEGYRSFAIFFDESGLSNVPVGQFNIKFSKKIHEEHPLLIAYIVVKVFFSELEDQESEESVDLTPKVFLTVNGEQKELDEDTIKTLDLIPFVNCDVTIHSHPWTRGERSGTIAILDELHVTS